MIENSSDEDLKFEIESKYENVHVEICKENLGFSKGMNLGIKLADTPFVFLNPADIDISNELLHSLEEITLNFKDFGMLTPAYKDRSIHSNFYIWKDKGPKQIINTQRKNYVFTNPCIQMLSTGGHVLRSLSPSQTDRRIR